tara:strand:+ start:891 stop:1112 length:222 start_codon:yes stop_codon:yes gene_type:complete
VTEYYDPLIDPIKTALNLTSGVLSYFTDDFSRGSDPGNKKKAESALEKERNRAEEARKMDSERTERARKRNRS